MILRFVLFALVLCTGAAHAAAPVDPPSRVARLSYVEGDVSFSPAGDDRWYRAQINRPQVAGDRLWIGRGGRAELELGGAALRMNQGTGIEILALDDRDVLVELSQGTLNLHVRRAWEGQSYEIATPTLAMVVRQPGDFRIDVDERGAWTEIISWRGFADIYGDRARFSLREGEGVRFDDPRLRGYREFRPPPLDAFDRFVDARNAREERALARGYVSEDMIGFADLDEYGRWANDREYGPLWYPRVAAGWAPYRDGRWIWQDPWGWTWVDDAPWGFAPSHYGRWLRVGGRWAWLPTPARARAVYAPAVVAFVGYGSGSIGWFPLGPRDVYVPGYRASRGYFDRQNSYRWIDSRVAGDVWNGYNSGRPRHDRQRYSHRDRDSQTVVGRDAFVNGRNSGRSRQQPSSSMDASAQVSALANMAPVQGSLAGGATAATNAPNDALFDRRVRARRAPAQADVPFDRRAQRWQRNPGQPIASDELERMREATPASEVQVVGESSPDLRGGQPNTGRDSGNRNRGRDTGADNAAEAQRQADAERARAEQEAALAAQRDAENRQRQTSDDLQREKERQRRDAERERQAQVDAQREAERRQQTQMDAERQNQEEKEQAERESRARYEQEQRDRELERQRQQTEREQQEIAREQADAQRNAERAQQEAEREAQRAQQEAEREAQREAQRAQQEAEREAQREAQRAQQEAEREAQREAEQAQREAEREAQREAEREAERERESEERERNEGVEEQPQRA